MKVKEERRITMAKDWVGNSSSFRTLVASNHTDAERQREDYYATEPKPTRRLAKLSTPRRRSCAWPASMVLRPKTYRR